MRTKTFLFILVLASCLLLVSSCSDDDDTSDEASAKSDDDDDNDDDELPAANSAKLGDDDDDNNDDNDDDDNNDDDDTTFDPFSFYMGWYGGVPVNDDSAGIIGTSAKRALFYHFGYVSDQLLKVRLDEAYANGLEVIMNVDGIEQVGSDVVAVDANRIREFVKTFKDHPAIIGWYTADEPSGIIQKGLCQTAYDAIKEVDTEHPVYLCLNHSDNASILLFASTYDVLIYDLYVFKQGHGEFYRLEDQGFLWSKLDGLKTQINRAASMAAMANRPWVFAAQGFGRALGCDTRLPTLDEHRFQVYYAAKMGARGILAFEYHAAMDSVADAADAYPYAGTQWLTDVYQPLAMEIDVVGDAIGAGPDTDNIADDNTDIYSSLYHDPNTGTVYLLAINESGSSVDVLFTLALQGNWEQASPLDGGTSIPLLSNQFADSFSQYETKLYELIPAS